MANKATLDFSGSTKLAEAMAKIPSKSEEVVNRVLLVRGTKEVMQAIIGFMPVSKREKKHAKYSNPLKERMFNLGFDIVAKGGAAMNKGSFGYLVFPNEGRGTHNPIAQAFFERGLASREEIILDYVIDELVRVQQELLTI
ncbi:hypothetical protein [Streptococcus suis]|uniref:Phage protein, HK97 gp10 family n=1 Tax=Streptococcus suis TaxID=1307 RepID=A0A7T1LAW9_STRSU|nr:hypothetical protein [Streptococcus suis]QPO27014.1 hypothetical protein I5V48_02425 [Streptococcus suis]